MHKSDLFGVPPNVAFWWLRVLHNFKEGNLTPYELYAVQRWRSFLQELFAALENFTTRIIRSVGKLVHKNYTPYWRTTREFFAALEERTTRSAVALYNELFAGRPQVRVTCSVCFQMNGN